MKIPVIEFKSLRSSAIVPRRATTHAYCYDVYASIGETFGSSNYIDVAPNKSAAIGIGFAVRVDEGYGMKIYSRSGQAYKNRVSLTNCVGIIDADYDKEVMVMLTNHGDENFRVSNGQAIAQFEIQRHQEFTIKLVNLLTPVSSNRVGGFGSTDKDNE